MGRVIKFRGKHRDNGEWVYGSLIESTVMGKKYFHIQQDYSAGPLYCYPVDPKTVGEYIGLKTKQARELYEGDRVVVKLPLGGFWGDVQREQEGIIKYEADKAGFIVSWEESHYGKNQSYVRLDCDIAWTAILVEPVKV